MPRSPSKEELPRLIRAAFPRPPPFVPGKSGVPLIGPGYGAEEVLEALDSLLSTHVTMGKKVGKFERAFARYIGAPWGTMVNSGSSANLLAFRLLNLLDGNRRLRRGDEIITQAVTWSTSVFPILDAGARPVFVDLELPSYTLDVDQAQQALSRKTKVLFPVHIMGMPSPLTALGEMAEDHGLALVEDACEAHGATIEGKRVGSFGDLSTFSFFFSHHMTTIEGGIVLGKRKDHENLSRSLRAHGWVRERSDRQSFIDRNPHIDSRFLFVSHGYNLRPTEIQAGFGLRQLPKLEGEIKARQRNARILTKRLDGIPHLILPEEPPKGKCSWFGYPILVDERAPFSRAQFTSFLEKRRIQTRPIMGGNIAEQPALRHTLYRKIGTLPNSRLIMRNGFFFGIHGGLGEEALEYLASTIETFVKRRHG